MRGTPVERWLVQALDGAADLDPDAPIFPTLFPEITLRDVERLLDRPETPDGVDYWPNVVYGRAGAGGRDLRLHLYAPKDTSEARPGIVFVHGGGWQRGHPFMHIRHANELAADGYVTATIEYRLASEATWPAALEDTKCALRWMRANSVRLGLDPNRLAVGGGCAGGYLSAMTALTTGRYEGDGGHESERSDVQAAVLWYPVTDMRPRGIFRDLHQPLVDAFLGKRAKHLYVEASPLSHVDEAAPPFLTITGDRDLVTPLPMMKEFHRALDNAVHEAVARPEALGQLQ